MKQISILTKVENGKFRRNTTLIKNAVKSFEGKEIEITIKRKYKQRSHQQNRFYWGVIIPMFQQIFYEHWGEIKTSEETHTILKSQCNYTEKVNTNTGEIAKIPQSTTELSITAWLEYEQKIRQFAMDFFNTNIPEPNEQLEFNFTT